MGRGRIIFLSSAEETIAFGRKIGNTIGPKAIICFFGDLGAGKTTLIKGIVSTLTDTPTEEVCSPTFSYLNIYEGKCPVYHFDLYRLNSVADFISLGFEEYFSKEGICCLEWSEKISSILPKNVHSITLKHAGGETRELIYEIPNC